MQLNTKSLIFSDSSISIVLNGDCSLLKTHVGKHTVTRIPPTEKGNRRHTSILSVALITIIKDVEVILNPKDLDITTMRSGGKGGQNVNKVESACRVRHIPTGLTVRIETRDQSQSKKLALQILHSKLLDLKKTQEYTKYSSLKQEQVGNMGRSNKVFTWNLYDGVIINHATGNQTRKLKDVFKGHLELL